VIKLPHGNFSTGNRLQKFAKFIKLKMMDILKEKVDTFAKGLPDGHSALIISFDWHDYERYYEYNKPDWNSMRLTGQDPDGDVDYVPCLCKFLSSSNFNSTENVVADIWFVDDKTSFNRKSFVNRDSFDSMLSNLCNRTAYKTITIHPPAWKLLNDSYFDWHYVTLHGDIHKVPDFIFNLDVTQIILSETNVEGITVPVKVSQDVRDISIYKSRKLKSFPLAFQDPKFKGINSLEISSCDLSGELPHYLGSLIRAGQLKRLNVSYNANLFIPERFIDILDGMGSNFSFSHWGCKMARKTKLEIAEDEAREREKKYQEIKRQEEEAKKAEQARLDRIYRENVERCRREEYEAQEKRKRKEREVFDKQQDLNDKNLEDMLARGEDIIDPTRYKQGKFARDCHFCGVRSQRFIKLDDQELRICPNCIPCVMKGCLVKGYYSSHNLNYEDLHPGNQRVWDMDNGGYFYCSRHSKYARK
jgi:hypothetical protein